MSDRESSPHLATVLGVPTILAEQVSLLISGAFRMEKEAVDTASHRTVYARWNSGSSGRDSSGGTDCQREIGGFSMRIRHSKPSASPHLVEISCVHELEGEDEDVGGFVLRS